MKSQKIKDKIMKALLSGEALPDLNAPETQAALEHLAAEGYVTLTRAWGVEVLRVAATDKGKAYFSFQDQLKKAKREGRWQGIIIGVLGSLIAAGILKAVAQVYYLLCSR